jgi:lycopene beta-cyclase
MSCYPFEKNTKRVLNIGTAGGWTKGTGYTFKKPDKKSTQLTAFLETDMTSRGFIKDQFWFYDLLLLDIRPS